MPNEMLALTIVIVVAIIAAPVAWFVEPIMRRRHLANVRNQPKNRALFQSVD